MAPQSPGTEIGAALRDARRRYGMEVREVEERTKIRARYIRALENEDWEALPAPAYVRGFLRTYGQLLGLDGEMLADEFRRRYGEGSGPAAPEPLLSEPRKPGEGPPSRVPLVLAVLGAIVILLLLLSLLGGDGDQGGGEGKGRAERKAELQAERRAQRKRQQRQERAEQQRKDQQASKLKPEDVKLTAKSTVQVCLVAGGDEALIDNQVLSTGTEESYSGSKRYRLTLGQPGSVRLVVGDSKRTLEVAEPASFEADSQGIREISYRGTACP